MANGICDGTERDQTRISESAKKKALEEDQGDQVSDSDYPAEMISTAFNEENEPYTEETQLLAIVNDLLYRLMDYQRDVDKWHDEQDVEQKNVLKLKEIVVENARPF